MSAKQFIITLVCALVLMVGGGYYLHHQGYSQGIEYSKQQVDLLNEQHEQKIEALPKQHEEYVQSVVLKYTYEVGQLTEQVQQLQNDKNTYNQYIGTYIPSSQYNYVPNGFVVWHDRAAKGERLDKIVLQNNLDDPSKYTYNDAMYAVGYNYTQANVCFTRLGALQTIVKNYLDKQGKGE